MRRDRFVGGILDVSFSPDFKRDGMTIAGLVSGIDALQALARSIHDFEASHKCALLSLVI